VARKLNKKNVLARSRCCYFELENKYKYNKKLFLKNSLLRKEIENQNAYPTKNLPLTGKIFCK